MTAPYAFAPRLLAAPEAAHYLSISETKLRGLGLPRKIVGGKRLYDRLTLDAYVSDLPTEGESDAAAGQGTDDCDAAFGVVR